MSITLLRQQPADSPRTATPGRTTVARGGDRPTARHAHVPRAFRKPHAATAPLWAVPLVVIAFMAMSPLPRWKEPGIGTRARAAHPAPGSHGDSCLGGGAPKTGIEEGIVADFSKRPLALSSHSLRYLRRDSLIPHAQSAVLPRRLIHCALVISSEGRIIQFVVFSTLLVGQNFSLRAK